MQLILSTELSKLIEQLGSTLKLLHDLMQMREMIKLSLK